MQHDALAAYQSRAVHTGHRGDLLIALYDGALRFASQARHAIVAGDAAAKGRSVDALLAILMEFTRTLNVAAAPQVGLDLQRLYAYFIWRAQQASMEMAEAPMVEIIAHLQRLRDTWAEAVGIARREGAF